MVQHGSRILTFRDKLYSILKKRKDAIINLLDALTCHGSNCNSVTELSNSTWFKRKYSSITDATTHGLLKVDWDHVQRLVYCSIEKKLPKIYFLLIAHQIRDVTQEH